MRFCKLPVAAMVAVIAATALFAAASASAATACKSAAYEELCKPENRYPAGTAIKAKLTAGTKFVVASGLVEVSCAGSSFSGKITANPGPSGEVEAEVTSWTFNECSGCEEVIAESTPYKTQSKWIGYNPETKQQQDEYQVHNFKVLLQKCPLGLQCTVSETHTYNQHTTATRSWITRKKEVKVKCGLLEETGSLSAEFDIVEPNPFWISQAP